VQRQRIGVARAIAVHPDLIVCDEPVSSLDVSVQTQVINLLTRLRGELGIAYLFITHDLAVVRHIADRVAVMYLGRIVEMGRVEEVYANPAHPYTVALLSAAPNPPRRPTPPDRPVRRNPEPRSSARRLQLPYPVLAPDPPWQHGDLRTRSSRSCGARLAGGRSPAISRRRRLVISRPERPRRLVGRCEGKLASSPALSLIRVIREAIIR